MHAFSQLDEWPVPSVSVAVLGIDREPEHRGDRRRAYPLASVSKLLTTYAVLIACDRGVVALDQPAGPSGSTLRHLLAHASGLGLDGREPISALGRRRIYSNAGIEVAAQTVEEATGIAFPAWLRETVLEPLGMSATELVGSPAWGITSCVDDLVSFAGELLDPLLLDPGLYLAATRVVFEGLKGVVPGYGRQDPNDWGLGFELRGTKQPHWTAPQGSPQTFGHFGRSGTFLWVDPLAELACICLTDRDFGSWAIEAWPIFSQAVLDEASS